MRSFKNILFTLAAFLWLPLSAHCQLESIPQLEFLRCAADEQPAGSSKDCDHSGCCAIEKSQYKPNQARVTVPLPDFLPLLPVVFADSTDKPLDEASFAIFTSVPPDLPKCWQFVFRMASPPRAPSSAS